jgi:hypothetical protein
LKHLLSERVYQCIITLQVNYQPESMAICHHLEI